MERALVLQSPWWRVLPNTVELDHVGLCWDGDLIRLPAQRAWQVRSFCGTDWQVARDTHKIAYRLNTYRVLLTRARYETIIWVPVGDAADRTRDPRILDGIADFLRACGVPDLAEPNLAEPNLAQPQLAEPATAGTLRSAASPLLLP